MAKRLLQIIAAAAAISAVTWYMTPDSFIFFGILHQIALASVLGLLFLNLPPGLTAAVAVLVVAAPHYLASDFFNTPILAWVGLSTVPPRSNDYVPLFPWFGAVLAGIAAARIGEHLGWLKLLSGGIRPHALEKPLTFIGRHSLAFYLIHQPVLISLVYVFSLVAPPAQPDLRQVFTQSCVSACMANDGAALCEKFCGCVVTELDKAKLFDDVFSGKTNQENNSTVREIAAMCSPVPGAGAQ
ncbi:hypothetical protein C066_01047 [Brucella sp. UK5/01]|nr:hypothetical protein C066_01047 [Brucella sp. UK5/01]ENT16060.1 hypothetical protein C067_01074 [Brucella sp. F8/99]ENT23287.1 hypothetical protein C051_01151 [Brucella sp. UK40/99]